MANALDLRGRVIITNGASGTLNAIRRDLSAVGAMSKRTTLGNFSANALNSVIVSANKLNRSLVGLRTSVLGAGFALGGIIATTRNFNESNFGYGFARITEFIKDGKLELDAWKAAMKAAADEARKSAEVLGTTPEVTMRAKEEVEKTGARGSEAKALYNAAIGLHLAEPRALDAGAAATFLYRVYSSYEKQRAAQAAKEGVSPDDPVFQERYYKNIAARTAFAASKSPLGPADTVEGMRQFAAQWAAMGIPYEFALAILAQGSKGFEAVELGTAYKSLVNKAINPTPTGLRLLNARGIDRSKYMSMEAGDPVRATTRLNSLLDGALFSGKGGKTRRQNWIAELSKMREDGSIDTPEGQQKIADEAMKVLGKGWVGKQDDVLQAVVNATQVPAGSIDLPAYMKALKDAGVTYGELIQIFEGRHGARYMPSYEFFDNLMKMYGDIQAVDGSVIDAVKTGRKESEAGKTDSLLGSWQNLVGAIEDTGVVNLFKEALTGLANTLRGLPVTVLQGFTASLLGLGVAALGLTAFGRAIMFMKGTLRGLGLIGGAAGAATGLGAAEVLGGGAAAALTAKGANTALKRMGSATAEGRFKGLGAGSSQTPVTGEKAGLGGKLLRGLGTVAVIAEILSLVLDSNPEMRARGDESVEKAKRDVEWLKRFFSSDAEVPSDAGSGAKSGAAGGLFISPAAADELQPSLPQAGSAVDAMHAQFAGVDFSADGRRMMESLAAGIAAGGASAIAAAQNVAAGVRAAGTRVPLNTGPNMQGSTR